MKLVGSVILALSTATGGGTAAAATLSTTYVDQTPDGHEKVWHATLDLRALPGTTRPATVSASVDASDAVRQGAAARVTMSLNGVVIGRAWARRDGTTPLRITIEDRLLATRNHITVAVTSMATNCPGTPCVIGTARMTGTMHITLAPANAMPASFAQYVTRFRDGITVRAGNPRDRALAELVVAAMAPRAPHRTTGPAEIIVSRTTPAGIAPELRFDTGPVEIKDRDGVVIYDEKRLDALTIMQVASRGDDTPVLWVRPGTEALAAAPIELDYGTIAMFGRAGREIAFRPDHDKAVTIAYQADAEREARFSLYWRLVVLAIWLGVTAGLVVILRKMPPLQPRPA